MQGVQIDAFDIRFPPIADIRRGSAFDPLRTFGCAAMLRAMNFGKIFRAKQQLPQTVCPLLLLLLSVLMPARAIGQPAAPAAPVWQIDWGKEYCTLGREVGAKPSYAFAIRSVPGALTDEVVLAGSGKLVPDLRKPGPVRLVLEPSSLSFDADAMAGKSGSTHFLRAIRIEPGFRAALAKSTRLRIEGGSRPILVPLDGVHRGLAPLQECIDSGMAEWGVDPKAFGALKQLPKAGPQAWLQSSDYPNVALDWEQTGTVIVRLSTDAAGKVTDCAVVQSSNSRSLDAATCQKAKERGRYQPASGSNGQAAPATFITYAVWKIAY